MSLRARLFGKLLLITAPLVALGAWLGHRLDHEARVEALHEFILTRMENGGREECEADPVRFPPRREPPLRRPPERPFPGRPGPGPRPPRDEAGPRREPGPEDAPRIELFAYDTAFLSANRHAPEFPADLRAALEAGATRADGLAPGGGAVRVAQRMAWDTGPCAVMYASRPISDGSLFTKSRIVPALLLAGGMILGVWFAAGPIVARVRRLTGAVRRGADDHYAAPIPVEGADELAQLATAFNEAGREVRTHLESVQQREEALRSFVANTMHDVMVPLTVLQGHLSALREVADVRGAIEEVQYTTSLLRNLAAVARLEADGGERLESDVDLGALVDRVVERHRPLARERRIDLEFAVPEDALRARGDLTLLEQAVSNLVHNAVRYNEDGGHVAVVLARKGERFELRVLDDGPGIAEGDLEHIRERSWRSDAARTRNPDGQGLGLHIASEAARVHGFALALHAREGGGLEVVLSGLALG